MITRLVLDLAYPIDLWVTQDAQKECTCTSKTHCMHNQFTNLCFGKETDTSLVISNQPVIHVRNYIKNSAHFVEKIRTLSLDESDLLVSFNAQNLFTRVFIDEAMTRVAVVLHSEMRRTYFTNADFNL